MATRFAADMHDIKAADFSTYELRLMSEEDLRLITRKCLELIVSGDAGREAANAMLTLVSAEKTQRASRSSKRATILWSILIVVSIAAAALFQAYVLYATSVPPADDYDDPVSCEQQKEFEV